MPSQSDPLQQPEAGDLEQVRYDALQRVAYFVIALEVKRIAKLWAWLYHLWFGKPQGLHELFWPWWKWAAHVIRSIMLTFGLIPFLWRLLSTDTNLDILDQMRADDINSAQSVARISEILQVMERSLTLNSEARKRYAVTIMQRLIIRRDFRFLWW